VGEQIHWRICGERIADASLSHFAGLLSVTLARGIQAVHSYRWVCGQRRARPVEL
jgi:hypothetical protein